MALWAAQGWRLRVRLTMPEARLALDLAYGRMTRAIALSRSDDTRAGRDLTREYRAICAEMAAAQYLDRYYRITETTDRTDVAGVEVRHTPLDDGCLILRAKDRGPVLLVTGRGREYTVRGWYRGPFPPADRYLRSPNGRPPAWFVPQEDLDGA